MQQLLISLLLLAVNLGRISGSITDASFTLSYIKMCLKPEFVYEPAVPATNQASLCAYICLDRGARCQGFWLPNDRCQLFEFDRCSHMVNAANCSQFGWAYVRKHENLPNGQLCPSGYGYNYYGSTYKVMNASSWTDALNYCNSEPGLTKFADALDRSESDQLHWIVNNTCCYATNSIFVGGYRIGNFASGTWIWLACNVTFLPELWMPGQPNEGDSYNKTDIWYSHAYGVDDTLDADSRINLGMCECINPFV